MRSIIFSVLLLLSYNFGLTQPRLLDSLKGELKVAKADTTKLRIYLLLGGACEKKDKLEYTEPALNLVDTLFLKTQKTHERKKRGAEKNLFISVFLLLYIYNNSRKEHNDVKTLKTCTRS